MSNRLSWVLRGARVALGPDEAQFLDLEIKDGRIARMDQRLPVGAGMQVAELEGCLILPGLINAHDHLDFNLYPRLGRGLYRNATEWARDIYRPEKDPIREQVCVPRPIRLFWGGLKNLLSGATTVCHHDPGHRSLHSEKFPVRVLKKFGWAHSLAFTPDLLRRFEACPPDWPFILHLGEGTDEAARDEIYRLDEMAALDGRSVLVHAVGLDCAGRDLVRSRNASIVWCPSSNIFLLGRTLSPDALDAPIRFALGSDSALTAVGDLLDEVVIAADIGRLAPRRLYDMVTVGAAGILRLDPGFGRIQERGPADLIAVADRGVTPADALVSGRPPVFVLVAGRLRLITPELASRTLSADRFEWSRVEVAGRPEVLVPFPMQRIFDGTARVLGQDIRLAGQPVSCRPAVLQSPPLA